MNGTLADRRHWKWYLKAGKPVSSRTDIAYVKVVKEILPGMKIRQPEKGTKEAEKQHFNMSVSEICKSVEK